MEPIFVFSVESLTLMKIDHFLTITQGIKIFKTYYKNGDYATATYRALRGDYGLHNHPTTQAIGKIAKKFEETGVVTRIERPVHHHFARFAENITMVSESVAEDPNVSIPRRSQELGQSYGTLWCILQLVKLTRQLKPADHSQRRRWMGWNGFLNNRRWTAIFRTSVQFSSAMKGISHTVGMLISKIVLRILK